VGGPHRRGLRATTRRVHLTTRAHRATTPGPGTTPTRRDSRDLLMATVLTAVHRPADHASTALSRRHVKDPG
jgi:hypothetical protein